MHLILDALAEHGLDDGEAVAAFIQDLVGVLPGVQIRYGPHVERFTNGSDYGPGITAFAIISESHIVLHTAPERKVLQLDVFSCKDFDTGAVKALLTEAFAVSEITFNCVLER